MRKFRSRAYIGLVLLLAASLSAWDLDDSLGRPGGIIVVSALSVEELSGGGLLLRADESEAYVSSASPIVLQNEDRAVLLLPLPCDYPDPLVRVRLTDLEGVTTEFAVEVKPHEFIHEEIPLNGAMTGLRQNDDPRKAEEARLLNSLLSGVDDQAPLYRRPLILPVGEARKSSHYGDRRLFRYLDGSAARALHYGVDYAVPTGTPVLAAAAGRVLLAAERMLTGFSVVIEHGPGIYTLYYHLDSLAAGEGELVEQGQSIGLSGMSGLATGAHLHWELRINRVPVDPLLFLNRPFF